MKQETHPTYYPQAKVKCACGNTFAIGSTQEKIETEICSQCHPFYTGKDNLVDTTGRIEKFRARLEKKEKLAKTKKAARPKKNKK